MRFGTGRKLLVGCLVILTCLGLSVFSNWLSIRNGASGDADASLNGQQAAVHDNSLRLESWGECFQTPPVLFLAAASLQADHTGRSGVREAWRRSRIGHGTAQLVFFLRFAETASRQATITEFHANQDLMVNSRLTRQDDLAMLQAAAAWFVDRCSRTRWMLFADQGAALRPDLVAQHAGSSNSWEGLPGLADSAGSGNSTAPRCLLLDRRTAEQVPHWPSTWQAMLSTKGFASVKDATHLFCHRSTV